MQRLDVDWLGLYLLEDVGPGDVTTDAVFGQAEQGRAALVARKPTVVAGLVPAAELLGRLGARLEPTVRDGDQVGAGARIATVIGPVRAVLAGERLALNLMARMSGIAAATQACMQALAAAGSRGAVAGTRKTTPGFRAFEKQAIRIGGGLPHRMGLWDEAMVKDNHIEACGRDAGAAVRKVRAAHPGIVLTCEAESLEHALAAAQAGADWVLIDNQAPAVGKAWAQQARALHPRVRIEASGGIRPADVAAYGWADRISMGWLTQGAPAADLALDWDAPQAPAAQAEDDA